jgi:hypothetical protein
VGSYGGGAGVYAGEVARLGKNARALAWRALSALPERAQLMLRPSKYGFRLRDIPRPVTAPQGETRLLIGPRNSAGQGHEWARAARLVDGVGALNMQFRGEADFGYAADYAVPQRIAQRSTIWASAQFSRMTRSFTHVLIESQEPIFGTRFGADPVSEAAALRRSGLVPGSVCHGSDIRLPSRHREHERYSPFRDLGSDLSRRLEQSARRRAAILDLIDGPEFVSTPDLLLDRPHAQWLPVVVDCARWQAGSEILTEGRPVVVHAPSDRGLKGTELVSETLEELHSRDVIDFRAIVRVPASRMPEIVAAADVVVDQFTLGIYGVAAVEAMAAGRLVVSHVSDFVRSTVRERTGLELPIVEATPEDLGDVLADVALRPDHYRERAAAGPAFVRAVHDGRRSALVLAPFLRAASPSRSQEGWSGRHRIE